MRILHLRASPDNLASCKRSLAVRLLWHTPSSCGSPGESYFAALLGRERKVLGKEVRERGGQMER